jgi:hypothetical protein
MVHAIVIHQLTLIVSTKLAIQWLEPHLVNVSEPIPTVISFNSNFKNVTYNTRSLNN